MSKTLTGLLTTLLTLLPCGWAPAREQTGKGGAEASGATMPSTATSPSAGSQEKKDAGLENRWIEIRNAELRYRYRYIDDTSRGEPTISQSQHGEVLRGRLKLDPRGAYSIGSVVQSGRTFSSAWNNTGLGTGDPVTNLYLKQLFFAAAPARFIEFEYGGIGVERGHTTEVVGYDNDAYLMGQRLRLKAPGKLFVDEVAVTYAFIGDTTKPNINKRFYRLKESNYHQFLVSKRLNSRVAFTADYTFQSGSETLRQAVTIVAKGAKVVDWILFENYERVDGNHPDYGCHVRGEKALHKRVSLGGGYASIDPYYNGLNSDKFNRGQRYYVTLGVTIAPNLTVSPFFVRGFRNAFAIANRSRFDLVVDYDLRSALRRTGLFRKPAAE